LQATTLPRWRVIVRPSLLPPLPIVLVLVLVLDSLTVATN
jgi:hypothetical protein